MASGKELKKIEQELEEDKAVLKTPLKTYGYFVLSILGILFLTYLMLCAWVIF